MINSKYFNYDELVKSRTAEEQGFDNTPAGYLSSNGQMLCDQLLDPLREALGEPLYVSSGYRSEELNHFIGGSNSSQHCKFLAADLWCKGKTTAELFELAMELDAAGTIVADQLIEERRGNSGTTWLHASTSRAPRHQYLKINTATNQVELVS